MRDPDLPLGQFLNSHINFGDIVLDIGCGDKCYHSFCGNFVISIDAWKKCKPSHIMDLEYEDLPFRKKAFDVVTMLDFIEHLPKSRGQQIIEQCQEVGCKVIVLTPLIWSDNEVAEDSWYYGNPWERHKSLWRVSDFPGWQRFEVQGLETYFLGVWHDT